MSQRLFSVGTSSGTDSRKMEHQVPRTVQLPDIRYCSPTGCRQPVMSRAVPPGAQQSEPGVNRTRSLQDVSTHSQPHVSTLPPAHSAPETLGFFAVPCATLGTRLPHKLRLGVPLPRKALPQISGSLTHFGPQSVRSSQIILYKTPLHPQYALLPS